MARRRRGDEGLTTLEWLLVVAAVAGLAALGVVVVQAVVGGTAEQVESHSARLAAAELAASVIDEQWRAEVPASGDEAFEINRVYEKRCLQLGIIYSDIDLRPDPKGGTFKASPPGWAREPGCTLA